MKKTRDWYEIETSFVKFEEIGQIVEGEIINIDIETSDDFAIYTLKDDNDVITKFHDSTHSKDLLVQCKKGDYIQLKYIDTQAMPNGELKIFSLKKSK